MLNKELLLIRSFAVLKWNKNVLKYFKLPQYGYFTIDLFFEDCIYKIMDAFTKYAQI